MTSILQQLPSLQPKPNLETNDDLVVPSGITIDNDPLRSAAELSPCRGESSGAKLKSNDLNSPDRYTLGDPPRGETSRGDSSFGLTRLVEYRRDFRATEIFLFLCAGAAVLAGGGAGDFGFPCGAANARPSAGLEGGLLERGSSSTKDTFLALSAERSLPLTRELLCAASGLGCTATADSSGTDSGVARSEVSCMLIECFLLARARDIRFAAADLGGPGSGSMLSVVVSLLFGGGGGGFFAED